MVQRRSNTNNKQPDRHEDQTGGKRHQRIADAGKDKSNRQGLTFANAFANPSGSHLDGGLNNAFHAAQQPHLRVAETKGLGEDRQQDVDRCR